MFIHNLHIHMQITTVKYFALLLPSQKETLVGLWGTVLVIYAVMTGKHETSGLYLIFSTVVCILFSPPL